MNLENAYLFQGMREETRKRILDAAVNESHAQGAFLFHQGDPAHSLYLLAEGRVRLSTGPKRLLAHVASEEGDAIGWSSLVENNVYTASAECLSPVRVLKVEKDRLEQILRDDPASGMAFFRHLAALIGRRLVDSYHATLTGHGVQEPRSYG